MSQLRGRRRARRRSWPRASRPTAPATRRSSGASSSGGSSRASCSAVDRDGRARARHRHRRARRGGRRHLPGHGRVAAADVGPRRPARAHGAGGLRRRRRRAGPVLLPPPDEFFDRAVEAAILDHANDQIYAGHLLCAAHEAPLTPGTDGATLGDDWEWHAKRLVEAGRLRADRRGRYVLRHAERLPGGRRSRCARRARTPSRSSTGRPGELIGTVEAARAFTTIHDGAVYLHMGRSYEVRSLDLDARHAVVDAVRRRLVHAAQEGDGHRDRAAARPPRGARRDAVLRRRRT